jgi:hypothetical protein
MSEQRMHFRGRYRGVFQTRHSGQTHAGVFHELSLRQLQIFDLQALSSRDILLEKTGDYYYLPSVKPLSRFGFGGIDISIWKDTQTAFSERIEEVVLQHSSVRSEPFSPLRKLSGVRTANNEILMEGVVFFSVLREESHPLPPAVLTTPESPPAEPPFQQASVLQEEPAIHSFPDPPPPPVFNPTLSQNRGCAISFRKIFFGLMSGFLLMKLILFFMGLLSHRAENNMREEQREGNAGSGKARLDPFQDTLAPMPWNYLYDHEVKWKDFSRRDYLARYTTATKEFDASAENHQSWRNIPVSDELLYFHDLYKDLSTYDKHKLDTLVHYFNSRRRSKNLDPLATSEMVISFVQEIPYVLVHDGNCVQALLNGGFIADYHVQRKECLPNIVAGVQSPYEFAHNMKGDCDTRSLLAYTLLDRLGISSSVWVSRAYGHSVLGVGLAVGSPNYKLVSGRRHYATELTVKGFRAGMLAPEHRNMNNWNVVLHNQ